MLARVEAQCWRGKACRAAAPTLVILSPVCAQPPSPNDQDEERTTTPEHRVGNGPPRAQQDQAAAAAGGAGAAVAHVLELGLQGALLAVELPRRLLLLATQHLEPHDAAAGEASMNAGEAKMVHSCRYMTLRERCLLASLLLRCELVVQRNSGEQQQEHANIGAAAGACYCSCACSSRSQQKTSAGTCLCRACASGCSGTGWLAAASPPPPCSAVCTAPTASAPADTLLCGCRAASGPLAEPAALSSELFAAPELIVGGPEPAQRTGEAGYRGYSPEACRPLPLPPICPLHGKP